MHRLARLAIAAALVAVCAVAPALAASSPKRGYYIDPKLQTYIITTKDISAIKSFQTACVTDSGGQNGSFIVSRKIKIKSGRRLLVHAATRRSTPATRSRTSPR